MERRLKKYVEFIKALNIGSMSPREAALMRQEMVEQLRIFQEERLIQLIITCVFALLLMMSYICVQISNNTMFMCLAILFLLLLVPFVRHYFVLESGIQSLYEYYDKITEKAAGMRIVPEDVKPTEIFQRRKGGDRRWHDVPVAVDRRKGERRSKVQQGPDKPDLDWDIKESAEEESWL
ncbi:MAG: hypothetical protein J6O55_03220 [Lachnospiraceae bacterium]|nr:hypothetical protein [Lachnospiraceae bacterium]